jgi:hypothetical protein
MKIGEEYEIRKIGDEEVLVSHKGNSTNLSRLMVLNPSAAFLIRETGHRSFDAKEWAAMLIERYGIDGKRAEADAEQLIAKLKREKVIE